MKGYTMSKETQKEVEVINLPVEVLSSCKSISVELSASHETHLTADKRMNTASALMLKLMGLKPDYNLLKQVQQVILNSLVNDHRLALTTSEKLFSQMLKQVQFANPKFVKPSKPTKDGLRMSAKRKELKEKYVHEALESVEAKLAKVNRVIGQAFIDNVKPKEDDIKLQKELSEVKKIKSEKLVSQQKEQQGKNLKAMVEKVQKMLKIDSGRLNKNNEPIFEYSLAKLDFAYRCLENEQAIKKFLADIK
jgi:hypothetical protein